MSLQDVRDVLHKIVDAAVGVGRQSELHADIDAIGAPAPAADPAPAETAAAEVPAEAAGETSAEVVPADDLAAFRAWQAEQKAAAEVAPVAASSEVTDAEAQS